MTVKNKETFSVKDTEYAIVRPSREIIKKARIVHSKTFSEALAAKSQLRAVLVRYMRDQGMWDDAKEQEREELIKKLSAGEKKLAEGGIKLTEARAVAVDMRRTRWELSSLMSERNALDAYTAEGQADNARFNYLISACLVYNDTGKPVYESVDQYEENSSDEVAVKGAEVFAKLFFDLDPNDRRNLPENAFLLKYKFTDDKLRLINKDGKLVDENFRLVDENGRLIDDNGKWIDEEGNQIDERGNFVLESKPFLDDDGNAIIAG